jgi:tetratricopeptide (TPR) repeat protein
VGPEVRRRGEQLLRDVRMLTELDEAHLSRAQTKDGVKFDTAGAEARYAAAFRSYGIDVPTLGSAAAVSRLRASAIHEALLAGLDGWMEVRGLEDPMVGKPVDTAGRAHLGRVANAADDNAWRRALREALLASDRQRLKALAEQPEAMAQSSTVLAWLGSVLQGSGLLTEARALLRQAQQRHPADFWVNYHLAWALGISGPQVQPHFEQAVGYGRAAVALRPRSAIAHAILADAFIRQGDNDAAIGPYQQALALDPKCVWIRWALTDALRGKGDLKGLLTCYQEAVEVDANNLEARYLLAKELGFQGMRDEAVACFKELETQARQALRLKPDDTDPPCYLAAALERQGRCKEAELEYRKAVRLKSNVYMARCSHAGVLSLQGRYKDAEAEYREAIRLKPDIPRPHNDLAWLLSTYPDVKLRHPGQALVHARKAVELAPDRGEHWNTLGVARYRNGDWQAAIEALNKSDALLKGNYRSFNAFFLAMAHWQLNEKEKATAWYDQAVTWMDKNDPQNEELKRFRAEAAALLGLLKAAESLEKNE